MDRFARLLLISFLESFATVLIQRGLYFYTEDVLHYTQLQNLMLAVPVGGLYIFSALISHRMTQRFGEKPVLIVSLVAQLLFIVPVFFWPSEIIIWIGASLFNFCGGFKWPILQSYVSAGRTPKQTAKPLGRFNMTWASAVPISIVVCGPIINYFPRGLFIVGAACTVISLMLIRPLVRRPQHLAHDHPERLDPQQRKKLRALMISSRWSMINSYGLLFLLAPLMPQIFGDLGYGVAVAAALSAGIDVLRVVFFFILRRYEGWHGKVSLLVITALVLPIGFGLVLAGEHLPTPTAMILIGEIIFGAGTGLAYYSSLYYGMITQDASVGAGGMHEAMIGSGQALGPGVGLAAQGLGPVVGGVTHGMFIAVGPPMVFMALGSLWPLWQITRQSEPPQQPSEPAPD